MGGEPRAFLLPRVSVFHAEHPAGSQAGRYRRCSDTRYGRAGCFILNLHRPPELCKEHVCDLKDRLG